MLAIEILINQLLFFIGLLLTTVKSSKSTKILHPEATLKMGNKI